MNIYKILMFRVEQLMTRVKNTGTQLVHKKITEREAERRWDRYEDRLDEIECIAYMAMNIEISSEERDTIDYAIENVRGIISAYRY